MKKFKNYNIDYDVVLNVFFDSVIKDLSDYRSRCNMSEESTIDETLSRLSFMKKGPREYLVQNSIYGNNSGLMGLTMIMGKGGYHDIRREPLVREVLKGLIAYYRIPTSKYYRDALDKALKEYFVAYEPRVLRQIQYTLMSPERILINLVKQNTK